MIGHLAAVYLEGIIANIELPDGILRGRGDRGTLGYSLAAMMRREYP